MSVRSCVLSGARRWAVVTSLGTLLVALSSTPSLAQASADNPGARDDEDRAEAEDRVVRGNEKARKYFQVLQRRPSPGYLFDRFYNAWLDTDSIAGLEGFLTSAVETEETTANRLLLAFFYAKQGENVRALEHFRTALEKDPGSAETWYQKALVEQRTLDFDTAIKDLEHAAAAHPKADLERDILQLQGRLHARSGHTDRAQRVWGQLLEKNPGDEELQEDLIELQVAEGLYKSALATAESLVAMTKDPYVAILRRLRVGDIHQIAGQREQALAAYASSLDKVGSDTWLEKEILRQIDRVFRREDDITGLEKFLQQLVAKHPKRVGLQRKRVDVLVELGEGQAAAKAFAEILKVTPGDRAVREDYVDMLARAALLGKAIEQLERLLEQHPDDAELFVKLAQLQHDNKSPGAAKSTLQRYLATSDGSEYAHLRTARLMERFGQKASADTVFQRLLKAFPESEGARDAYAAFLHRVDRKREAIDVWKELAGGADRERLVRVARALSSRGENEAAFDLLYERLEDLRNDSTYLTQLCTVAISVKKFKEAMPWVRRLVAQAETPLDVENAVARAALVAERADMIDDLSQELTTSELPQEICLLANLYERTGDSKRAEEALARIGEVEPLLTATQRVQLFRHRRDYERAAKEAAALVGLPGGRRVANVQKVVELFKRAHDLESALEWIPEWKKLTPGSTLPWLSEAKLQLADGRNAEAVDVLRRAAQQFDGDAEIRAALAGMYAADGKLADAERIYLQLYEESESVTTKLRWVQEIARIAEMRGTSGALIEQFEERRKNNRTSITPLLALAEIYRESDDYEGRRRVLLEAARLKPQNLDLLLAIARVEESEQEYDRALSTLESAVKVAPEAERNRIRERIARLHFGAGEDEEGFHVLQEIAGGDNLDSTIVENLAQSMMGIGDWTAAAEFLRPFVEKLPDQYRIGYLYAVALEEDRQESAALAVFSELLRVVEEPQPENSPSPPSSTSGRFQYLESLRQLVPEATIEIVRLQNSTRAAYQHRQESRRRFHSTRVVSPATVNMPHDIDALHSFCLVHLSTLAQQLDEDGVAGIKASLVGAGIPFAKYFSDIDLETLRRGRVLGLLEKYPNDEAIMALALITQRSDRTQLDVQQLQTAAKMFEKNLPELVYLAGLAAASIVESEDVAIKELIEKSLRTADTIESPSMQTLSATLRAVGSPGFGTPSAPSLSEAQKKTLVRRLVDWYPKVNHPNTSASWVFPNIAGALANSEGVEALLAFLDEEVAKPASRQSTPASRHARRMVFGRRGNELLLVPLTFPPSFLVEFPSHVLEVVADDGNHRYRQILGEALNLDADALQRHVDQLKSPILRALLAHRAVMTDAAKKAVRSLVEAKEPSIDGLLLAAAYAADVDEDLPAAVEYAKRARFLPMTRALRRRLDAAILAWSVAGLSGDFKADEPIKTAGRDAALRLRRAPLAASEREELVAALEQLELSDEARKLEARVVPAAKTPGLRVRSRSPFRPQSQSRVQKLLTAGERDRALAILASDLKRFASSGLQPQSAFRSQYDLEKWLAQIAAHDLGDELLKQVDPGANAGPRRMAQFAYACEVLGQKEKAREIYTEVAAERRKDMGVRLRLVALTLESDLAAGADMLTTLDPFTMEILGQYMYGVVHSDTLPYAQRLAHVETVVSAALRTKNSSNSSLQWIIRLLDSLDRMRHVDGVHIGGVYDVEDRTSTPRDEARQEKIDGLRKQRREVHDRLCRALLGAPQLAREGFRRLSGFMVQEGQDADAFRLAKDAILAPSTGPGADHGRLAFLSRHHGSEVNKIPMWEAEQFVVLHAYKEGDRSLIEQDIATVLEGRKGRTNHLVAEALRKDLDLYFTAPEDFLDHARQRCEEARRGTHGSKGTGGVLTTVVEAWKVRELDVDLSGFLFKELIDTRNQGRVDSHVLVFTLMLEIHRRRGEEAIGEALEQLAGVYLGPKTERAALFEKHFDPTSMQHGTRNATLHEYLRIVEQLSRDSRLFYTIAEHYETDVQPLLGSQRRNIWPQSHPLLDRTTYTDFETATELLEASPLIKDGAEVRFYLARRGNLRDSFFVQVASQMQSLEAEPMKKYVTFFRAQNTLGGSLLAALVAREPSSWNAFLENHRPGIKAQPPRRLAQLSRFVREEMSAWVDVAKLSPDAVATLEWMKSQGDSSLEDKIERLLAAYRLTDLKIQPHELDDRAREYLKALLPQEPKKAARVFWKATELMRNAQRTNRWHMSYGDDRTFSGNLLESLLSDDNRSAALGFVYEILAAPNPIVKVEAPRTSALEMSLRHLKRTPRRNKRTSAEADRDALREAVAKVADVLPAKHCHLATPALFGLLQTFVTSDSTRNQEILELLKEESQRENFPELAKQLHVVATALALKSSPGGAAPEEREAGLKEVSRRFLENLRDPTIRVDLRLRIAASVVHHCGDVLPFAVTAAAVDVLEAAWSQRSVVSRDDVRRVIKHFLHPVHERDDLWQTSGKKFVQAWKKKVLLRPSDRGGHSSYRDQEILQTALKLCFHLGDEQSVNQILARSSDQLDGGWLVFFIRSGTPEQVTRILMRGWERLDWRSGSRDPKVAVFDDEIAAKLPELVEGLESPEMKLFLEAFVKSLPDASTNAQANPQQKPSPPSATRQPESHSKEQEKESEPPPKLPSRDERLVELSERVNQHEFQNVLIRDAVFSFLVESALAAQIMADKIKQVAPAVSPLTFMTRRSGSGLSQAQRSQKQKLFAAHLRLSLQSGPESALETLAAIERVQVQNSVHIRRRAIQHLVRSLREAFRSDASDWTPEARRKNAGFWTAVLSIKDPYQTLRHEFTTIAAHGLVYSTLEGGETASDFQNAFSALDETTHERLTQDYGFSETVLREISHAMKGRDIPREVRRAAALSWLSHPAFEGSLAHHGGAQTSVFQRLVSAKLLSEEELLHIGTQLVKASPREGNAASELAKFQVNAKQFEAALETYREGIRYLPPTSKGRYSRFHVEQAKILKRLDRRADALAVLDSVDTSRLSDSYTNEFHSLHLELKLAALVAAGMEREVIELVAKRFTDEAATVPRAIAELGVALQTLGDHFNEQGEHEKAVAYLYLAATALERAESEKSGSASHRFDAIAESLATSQAALGRFTEPVDFISKGAKWKYFDAGEDLGGAWRETDFDDAAWEEGSGKFGYGDGEEVTTIDFGPDPGNKHITTYFRKEVLVDEVEVIKRFTVHVLRDDGVVVYLNGVELFRDNMPAGDITFTTQSVATVGRSQENLYFKHSDIDVQDVVREGKNVVAVELHQRGRTTSDSGFDLFVRANERSLTEILQTVTVDTIESTLGDEVWSAIPPAARLLKQPTPEEKSTQDPASDTNNTDDSGAKATPSTAADGGAKAPAKEAEGASPQDTEAEAEADDGDG